MVDISIEDFLSNKYGFIYYHDLIDEQIRDFSINLDAYIKNMNMFISIRDWIYWVLRDINYDPILGGYSKFTKYRVMVGNIPVVELYKSENSGYSVVVRNLMGVKQ